MAVLLALRFLNLKAVRTTVLHVLCLRLARGRAAVLLVALENASVLAQ